MGTNCELLYDACAVPKCPSGWTCSATPGLLDYECTCGPGVPECSVNTDPCGNSPCKGPHFECVDRTSGYVCECRMGPNGEGCHTESPVCSSHPCQNNGTCTEHAGEYACSCPPGHSGARCEDDIDECASSPCQNGAICLDRGHFSFGTGINCENEIDECDSDPCQNGGVCADQIGLYTCSCAPGYEGIQCEVDIDDCESHPCINGGTCHDLTHGHICRCQSGFSDATCSTPTTFSIGSRGSLLIDVSMNNNQSRRDMTGDHPAMVSLRFRTTLPDAILFYRGHDAEYLFLELSDGMLHVGLKRNGAESPLLLEGLRVDDGQWHKAEVLLQQSLELKLWHKTCDTGVCLKNMCSSLLCCPKAGESVAVNLWHLPCPMSLGGVWDCGTQWKRRSHAKVGVQNIPWPPA
uniref:Uncharacterized protein n=1 Tax=Pelusios castaneus TaxID=367368 RepID=A0A8C8RJU1_9SAUR